MKNTFLLLAFISIFLSNNKVIAQCAVAEKYVSDIQNFQDNAAPTEYASSGKKIQAWTQFATWNTYKCQCDSPENLSDSEIPQLINAMNATRGIISKEYFTYGEVPRVYKVSDCKKGNSNSTNSASSKTSTQIEMEKRFQNYNNAMNLKRQGENIAKAYAQQVKSYGELNSANSPEALLQNFNNNMQAIADLEAQNKEDNLNQLSNILNSSLNDLNTGNYEGAMFSTLSLLDQAEAKREAQKEADAAKGRLAYQTKQKMTAFYTKAVELNDDAIKQYNEKAAYAYSKEEETYLLEHIENLECHKNYMETNFNYSSTAWTQNRCAIPDKRTYTVNNLIAKDIQYINAAKRKYALYEKTGEPIFQQGAMRFAGLAATENPKTEYYYLMGHFAGTNNPLVAYSSFLTVESKNAKYFEGEKATEYSIIKMSLELYLKKAVEENNQEVIKNIVGANLHRTVSIDGYLPIIHAIKIDQADVVFAFLNTELEGKPQNIITKKVQEVISMAAILDAPKTIQKFADIGFSVDFIIDGKTPLDAAEESLSLNSFKKIEKLLGGQSKYNEENSDLFKINLLATYADINDSIKVQNIFSSFQTTQSKHKAFEVLLYAKKRESFFLIYEKNKEFYTNWVKENRDEIFQQFASEILYVRNRHVSRYLSSGLLTFSTNKNCLASGHDLDLFNKVWLKHDIKYIDPNISTWNNPKYKQFQAQQDPVPYDFLPKRPQSLQWFVAAEFQYNDFVINNINESNNDYWLLNTLQNINSTYSEAFPFSYEVDLFSLAVWRRDYTLLKLLYQGGHFTDNKYMYFPGNSIKTNHYRDLGPVLYSELIENTYLILDYLINDMKNIEKPFQTIVSHRFYPNFSETDNECYKKILDKLIENGQADTDVWVPNKKRVIKNIKSWEDGKYWKAILEGKFDNRY
jgi:hypothetical protein